MKLMKTVLTFLSLTTFFTGNADENKQVFIGKTSQGGEEKVAFILNLLDSDVEKYLRISEETGEVFLKVDSLIGVSKDALVQTGLGGQEPLSIGSINSREEEPDIKCSGCRQYYNPKYYKGRKCPNCGTVN